MSTIMKENSASDDVVSLDNELEVFSRFESDVLTRLKSNDIMLGILKKLESYFREKLVNRGKDKGERTPSETEIAEQLAKCEWDIYQLNEFNGKLIKNINGVVESGESEKVMEKVIEGIKGLQLDIWNIQDALLKLDNENDTKEETIVLDTNELFSLGDYQHDDGSRKETVGAKSKKIRFFACFKLRIKGQ